MYYAEMEIIIDCDKLKKGKTGGELCLERKKREKGQEGKKKKQTGV